MNKNKPALAFPYHDPSGKYNRIFEKNIELLKKIFDEIYISATPQTVNTNKDFLKTLNDNGFRIYENGNETNFGDHFRNAFKLIKLEDDASHVYFGFIDRILFALETEYRENFIEDMAKEIDNDLLIYSRSDFAWNTHPKDYYEIEKIVTDAGKIFTDYDLDWIWCGAMFSKKLIKDVLLDSASQGLSAITEFTSIAINKKYNLDNKKVDWLAWEDLFWAKENNTEMPKEMSREEKEFRMKYCLDSIRFFLK